LRCFGGSGLARGNVEGGGDEAREGSAFRGERRSVARTAATDKGGLLAEGRGSTARSGEREELLGEMQSDGKAFHRRREEEVEESVREDGGVKGGSQRV
jgi:hypothetical protein